MDPAWLSLGALAFVILASGWEKVGVGVLSLALAWAVGHYFAGLGVLQVAALFPSSLFLTLFGVTLFFGLASDNGTLHQAARLILRAVGGRTGALPAVFFLLALTVSTFGPGNIGAVAMLAPFAMAVAGHTALGAFFMTVILVTGANAGAFSPFAPTGIIANEALSRIGIRLEPWTQMYLPSLIAQGFIALSWYAALSGRVKKGALGTLVSETARPAPFERSQRLTVAAVGLFLLSVIFFKADVGFLAISLAALLMLLGAADTKAVARVVPWNVLMMVCGVSTLVQVCDKSGGLGLFTDYLAKVGDPATAPALLAWVSGIVSTFSSSSGVVLPAFIPLVPDLIAKMGGGSPAALVSSINVGSHVVDISPLSTLGALCVASAGAHVDKTRLFRRLLVWGLLMSFYGALVCFIFFGLLADRFFVG